MQVEWVVPYCRDGGQACIADEKFFTDIEEANHFFRKQTNRIGHHCPIPPIWIRLRPDPKQI
jgi:hypothetical protein